MVFIFLLCLLHLYFSCFLSASFFTRTLWVFGAAFLFVFLLLLFCFLRFFLFFFVVFSSVFSSVSALTQRMTSLALHLSSTNLIPFASWWSSSFLCSLSGFLVCSVFCLLPRLFLAFVVVFLCLCAWWCLLLPSFFFFLFLLLFCFFFSFCLFVCFFCLLFFSFFDSVSQACSSVAGSESCLHRSAFIFIALVRYFTFTFFSFSSSIFMMLFRPSASAQFLHLCPSSLLSSWFMVCSATFWDDAKKSKKPRWID